MGEIDIKDAVKIAGVTAKEMLGWRKADMPISSISSELLERYDGKMVYQVEAIIEFKRDKKKFVAEVDVDTGKVISLNFSE